MENKKIEFGICCNPDETQIYADAGFDYFETTISTTFQGDKPEDQAGDFRSVLTKTALPCKTGCGFLPGNLKISGPEANPEALARYVENAVSRAASCGLETIVFGSGGARSCPEGFPMESAAKQVENFLRNTLPVLDKYGVTLVVEPLCSRECNVLNTVASAAVLVQKINHPRLRLLADSYHFMQSDRMFDALVWAAPLLRHIHLASSKDRLAPGKEPDDPGLEAFLAVLKHSGYSGRLTVECRRQAPLEEEARLTINYLRKIWNSIKD